MDLYPFRAAKFRALLGSYLPALLVSRLGPLLETMLML